MTAYAPSRREVLALATLVAACRSSGSGRSVVCYTSVDQVFASPIFAAFEAASGIAVRGVFDTEETKSTGVLNRLIAEADRPRADVFWSGDPVRPFALIKRGLVEAYVSPAAARIPSGLKAADGAWTGFAARARVLLINTQRLPADARPSSLRDLADPRWRNQIALANPVFGTTTIHVAALVATWGEPEARAFLEAVKANGARIASSNGEVKKLVVDGEVAFGLTDTDDASEAVRAGAPVAIVYPDRGGQGTLVMPTVAVMIKGGPAPEPARRLIDHLVSADVERQLEAAGGYMPVGTGVTGAAATLADVTAMTVDFAVVANAMERIQPWLREWAGL